MSRPNRRREGGRDGGPPGPPDRGGGPHPGPPRRLRGVRRADGRGVEVYRGRADDPVVAQVVESDCRSFVRLPLLPDDSDFLAAGSPDDEPRPPRLFLGFGDVNGVDFLREGSPGSGTFHPMAVGPQHLPDGRVLWSVITDWRAPDGASLLGDSQRWTLADHGDRFELDLLWTLGARVDLRFGQSDGGLLTAAPWDPSAGASARNSEGLTDAAADGRPARWVTVARPGSTLTVLAHPDNPGHPEPWRVDAQLGFGPNRGLAGTWTLAAGEMVALHYRLVISNVALDPAAAHAAWEAFAREGREDSSEGAADDERAGER